MSRLPIVLLLALTYPVPAPAQSAVGEGSGKLRDALASLPQLRKKPAGDIKINGVTVSGLELSRQVVYRAGTKLLDAKLIDLAVAREAQKQIDKGTKANLVSVSDEELEEFTKAKIAEFNEKNPDKDFFADLERRGITRLSWEQEQRLTLRIDKVFFRGEPKDWPATTWKRIAKEAGASGDDFVKKLRNSLGDKPMPAMWANITRQWVRKSLRNPPDVKLASDGLDATTCLSVGDQTWKTRDAAREVSLDRSRLVISSAMLDAVLSLALKAELQKTGAWLDDDEAAASFAEYRKKHDSTPFTTEVMAKTFKGFPNVEVFAQRWRLMRSFERMIKDEITDAVLRKHVEGAGRWLTGIHVSARVIRIPARGAGAKQWKRAREAASELATKIRQKGIDFSEAMARHSKWPSTSPMDGSLDGGFNQIRKELRESEYTAMTSGITRALFTTIPKDEIAGPIRGNDGYYIIDLASRAAGAAAAPTDEHLRMDYLLARFAAWADTVAARTKVE